MKKDYDEKRVCSSCVKDAHLKKEIEQKGRRRKCSYCEDVDKTYTLTELSNIVEEAFLEHYERTPDEPSDWEYMLQHVDKESNYNWEREGENAADILMEEMGVEPEIAGDIETILEAKHFDLDSARDGYETDFLSEALYERKGVNDDSWQDKWRDFENILKTQNRYFSSEISDYLKSIFYDIEDYKAYGSQHIFTSIGPGTEITHLYRSRVFQTEEPLLEAISYPDILLGTPSSLYVKGGRMNASGIAVFYGATTQPVALSEVRPPVGSKVATAKFEVLRNLSLLDLTKLGNARTDGSIFDSTYSERLRKALFLRKLSERLVRPVMPDHETFEYLPTQVIADYLASGPYDGIIFPSAQVTGPSYNIVLFNKAARVEKIVISQGVKIRSKSKAYEEEGEYTSYEVAEVIPAKNKLETLGSNDNESHTKFEKISEDERKISLKIDLDEIEVSHIKAVKYEFEMHKVSRYNYEETNFNTVVDF